MKYWQLSIAGMIAGILVGYTSFPFIPDLILPSTAGIPTVITEHPLDYGNNQISFMVCVALAFASVPWLARFSQKTSSGRISVRRVLILMIGMLFTSVLVVLYFRAEFRPMTSVMSGITPPVRLGALPYVQIPMISACIMIIQAVIMRFTSGRVR